MTPQDQPTPPVRVCPHDDFWQRYGYETIVSNPQPQPKREP